MFGIPRNGISFINLISSSGTSTKREAAAIITSAEVIIAKYDAILSQWERANFYNHLSNYTYEQLLDEVEHDIMNYQNRCLCYLAEADNTDTRFY